MQLAQFFIGAAAKQLSVVEADRLASNQHELNGINSFREILGIERRVFETVFMYLTDEDDPIQTTGQTTWYDTRYNKPARSAEYRLYFPSTEVSAKFRPGDLLIIGRRSDDTLLIASAPSGSSIGDQLLWLFGLEAPRGGSNVRIQPQIEREVDYIVRWILDAIGIEAPPPSVNLDLLQERFGLRMPTTRVFSEFAREQSPACDPIEDPDFALMAWLETEELYFRAFERILLENRLRSGFVNEQDIVDVDGFVSFSLSVQNRRKSRAGHSLENHLEKLFSDAKLQFERGATTEGRSRPDFLFPGGEAYHDDDFAASRLTVLGAKATCKDRWRQVTAEADRVEVKHLVTLEPSISTHQTQEMRTRNVQLVLPRALHTTYSADQQAWLWTVAGFVQHVRTQQT